MSSAKKIKAQGIDVMQEAPVKNPFNRFGEWLNYFFWDIHWMSNVYIAAIIRDYLRFFIKNTPAVGNYVYEHNPEGYRYTKRE